ncbi:MAG TPA: ankyrin repeat domain-containing protein, partial [Aquella sp.]|nr:ankyrin repeat domain-containing protein [Aquella sp.]
IHVLKWFKKHNLLTEKQGKVCLKVAEKGHFESLKWLIKNGYPLSNELCNEVIKHGNLEILKWLVNKGCELNDLICDDAANHGQLEILKWLVERGCKMLVGTAHSAAFNGHLELLQWMVANGCPTDAKVPSCATYNGHLDVVKWVRENGCEWDAESCESTVIHNHLDILKWLRSNGCPWDESICINAMRHRNTDILYWAIENSCEWGDETYLIASTGKDSNGNTWYKKPDKNILKYLNRKLEEREHIYSKCMSNSLNENNDKQSCKLTELINMRVAGRQHFRCANKPGSQLIGLENIVCPEWTGSSEGSFNKDGYEIDHTTKFCINHDDSEFNLQALCPSCHRTKYNKYKSTMSK